MATAVTTAQSPDEPTEGMALIRRMAGGDREAFAAFYDRYSSLAFSLIRRTYPSRPKPRKCCRRYSGRPGRRPTATTAGGAARKPGS